MDFAAHRTEIAAHRYFFVCFPDDVARAITAGGGVAAVSGAALKPAQFSVRI
jgi:hypothetical protein